MKKELLIALLAMLMFAGSANADRRKYVWTYQYGTIAQENTEIEFYQTTKLNDKDKWEYRIEIEHGLTPNWDMSIYQIFAQVEDESLKWDAFQIRTRYRLAEPGRFFMDPLLYLEYNRKTDFSSQNKAEAKLILTRRADRVDFSVNPVYEFFWAPGEPKHEVGLDVGLSYELSFQWSIGVESTSRLEFVSVGDNEVGSYVGPTISFASGHMFYTVGYATGITDDSDDARVRFIMGVGL
ncbi:MAG: hypothetical protein V3T31_12820 [candidate division Zixibacteria bacterium]